MASRNGGKTARRRGGRLLALLAAVLALALFLWDQQNRLQPETLEVPSARLPAAFDGLQIGRAHV